MMQKYANHFVFLTLLALTILGVGAINATADPAPETAAIDTNEFELPPETKEETTEETTDTDLIRYVDITPIPTVLLDNVPLITDNSLVPELDSEINVGQQPSHNFQTHIVERGEAPRSIADQSGIQIETILGGNPKLSNEASALQTGIELIILPVDGVLHTVSFGDSLESISARYGIPVADIIAYADNNLEFPYRLYPDTQIVVPGAQPEAGFVWNPPTIESVAGINCSPEIGAGCGNLFVSGSGFHTWPIANRRLTQGYWVGHQAYDVGAAEGTAIVASDTGTVTYAAWSPYCYGNLVVVNHGNTGHETFYAHLSSIAVSAGQVVNKGQYLGASGNTGCSSGPHLHYEIRIWGNRDNPAFYLP